MPEGRAGRCVGAGVSRGAKSHTAQIDKHQSDVCTLLHASLSLSYVSISTPCDFLYYLQFRTYFSEALLPGTPCAPGGGAAKARLGLAPAAAGRRGGRGAEPRRAWRWESRRRTPLELNWTNAYVANSDRRGTAGASTHHRAARRARR